MQAQREAIHRHVGRRTDEYSEPRRPAATARWTISTATADLPVPGGPCSTLTGEALMMAAATASS